VINLKAMQRPAKVVPVDQEQARHFAAVMGMAPEEIIAVSPDPGGKGTIVTTHDGMPNLISPDDRYIGYYRPGASNGEDDEPWTLDDLNAAADQLGKVSLAGNLNALLYAPGGYAPIRAFAVWKTIAADRQLSMAEAAVQVSQAAECRRVILASGWLTAADAAKV
jgi:hypothetical protein